MMAALPDKAYAKPAKPRKLLVYGIDNESPSQGFVHSSIAIQAAMMKAMGDKLGTWSTTISYNPADFNTENLKQYDAILLDSTTGCFLDQPGDKAATDARRAALLAFVREGKGLGGIHASTDSYHSRLPERSAGGWRGERVAAVRGRGGAGGGAAAGPGGQLATTIVTQADKNTDQKLTMAEMTALANEWFDKMDTDKSGRIAQADFAARYAAAQPQPAAAAGRGGAACGGRGAGAAATQARRRSRAGRTKQPAASASWPEWTKVIGGYFKYHWNNGTHIPVKVDDPKSPLTVMFGGKGFEVIDETYTFAQDSFSRTNVHVLTSVDYDSDAAGDEGHGAGGDGAHRRRLRAELHPSRGQGPRVLRGERPRREHLRDEEHEPALPRAHAVRHGRPQGGRQPERQGDEVGPKVLESEGSRNLVTTGKGARATAPLFLFVGPGRASVVLCLSFASRTSPPRSATFRSSRPPDFEIDPASAIAVIGRNGTGKSTLLKILNDDLAPDAGQVWRGPGLSSARLDQDVPLVSDRTVFDVVADGLGRQGELVKAYHHAAIAVADAPTDAEPDGTRPPAARTRRVRRLEHRRARRTHHRQARPARRGHRQSPLGRLEAARHAGARAGRRAGAAAARRADQPSGRRGHRLARIVPPRVLQAPSSSSRTTGRSCAAWPRASSNSIADA